MCLRSQLRTLLFDVMNISMNPGQKCYYEKPSDRLIVAVNLFRRWSDYAMYKCPAKGCGIVVCSAQYVQKFDIGIVKM